MRHVIKVHVASRNKLIFPMCLSLPSALPAGWLLYYLLLLTAAPYGVWICI